MTSYNYSYNVLINRLEAFAAGHFLIKRFTHGQIDMSDQLQDDQYPFMHVTPDTITPIQGGMQFGFHIMFADIPRDKEYKAEYQREVISDCIRLGQDLIAEVQNGLQLFGFDVQLVNDVTFEPFMEEQKNTVTGVAFTIKLEVPWDWSACDIPAIWSVGGAGGSGGSGTGYGVTLQTNGVDNVVQNLLNLEEGNNITIVDNGNGTITINSTGGGGSGTVTSVALTAPAAFNVSGSPITGAGTLALSAAGNSNQYIDGAGNLQSFPSLSQTLQQVTTAGNETTESIITENVFGFQVQTSINQVLADLKPDASTTEGILTLYSNTGFYSPTIYKRVGINNILFPTSGTGTFALSVNGVTPNAATGDITISAGSGTVTSVGHTMPSAFSVTGSPVTTSGTLAVTGAGLATQYVRGDGQLANFPTTSGGGSSVSYYLNGSINQGTIGGSTYYQMSKTAVFGAGTDFTRTNAQGNGLIAQFITDVNDPNVLLVPGGNFNLELYFSASSSGGTPSFYVELYKYDGTTFTLLATDVATPEGITQGTVIDAYFTALAVPATTMALTDRLALRVFVTTSGRTLKLHTEDSHLSQVITTLSTGVNAINGLTSQVQNLATGTAGSDFAISSTGSTHTFNLPTASAANRGALSSADWSTFNGKQNSIGLTTVGNNLATLPNPSAVTYLRVNADNTVTARTPAQVLTDLGVSSNIILFRDFTIYTLANTAVNTLVWSSSVAANTLQVSDIIDFQSLFQSNTPNGTAFNLRLYVNTSASLVGATQVGRFFVTNASTHGLFYRQIAVTATGVSGNIRVYSSGSTGLSGYTQINGTTTNITVNTTAPIFFILAFEMGNATSTSSIQYINALISR
jgi:hypothetical protein